MTMGLNILLKLEWKQYKKLKKRMLEMIIGINVMFTRFEFFKRLTLIKLKKVEENAQGVVSTNK